MRVWRNEKYETVHDKYIPHKKGEILSSESPKVQLQESHRRGKKCIRARWWQLLSLAKSALTSTSTCLTRFKAFASFLFIVFVAMNFTKIWWNLELVVDHQEPFLVLCEPVEGGNLQDHQHPPWAAEDQVRGKVTHSTMLSSTLRSKSDFISLLAGVCAVRGRGDTLQGGDQGRLLRPPCHLLH